MIKSKCWFGSPRRFVTFSFPRVVLAQLYIKNDMKVSSSMLPPSIIVLIFNKSSEIKKIRIVYLGNDFWKMDGFLGRWLCEKIFSLVPYYSGTKSVYV